MTARIIDGKARAEALRAEIAAEVAELKGQGLTPGLAVVLVGDDPASDVYVRSKAKQTVEVGMYSVERRLPKETTQAELLALVDQLNRDPKIHGILVQLPLPKHIDSDAIITAIDPDKDVDGLHPINAGRLLTGLDGLFPCTPLGCVILAKSIHPDLTGLEAVVVGRSNLVGKPVAQLLLRENATVTTAHSRSRDLAAICRRADLLIVAVGKAGLVRGDWIKPGATVIDVGTNRIVTPEGRNRLVGDVAFDEAKEVAGAITPVPGGVGPMTIANLLANALRAAKRISGIRLDQETAAGA
ncbi:MAG TPA: bifunctional methylenetetrahydrofolate dehydrogenase/methenyltetrahydrofolate cyclohydrolase FolD [Hyphomicrobiales bacterium]|nr:bifunctional methylenetetrahydrofolate dehydrogenase/methenyltetrahydrofolate cyclohydrolase FolD [Hyphomicrobiales bacterium]